MCVCVLSPTENQRMVLFALSNTTLVQD
ncbi:hypothetical protein A2U01_0095108, partial [Trifolium medium]|nr:hypothetical protein [Trifolium medium]